MTPTTTGTLDAESTESRKERRARRKIEKAAKPKRYYDFTLLALILVLVVFGVMMVASSSVYAGMNMKGKDPFYFSRNQAKYALIGIAAMLGISIVPYKVYRKRFLPLKQSLILPFYMLCLGLQFAVLIKGQSTNGSSRWLQLPVLGRFQPSELTKLCLIFVVASWAARNQKKLDRPTGFLGSLFFPAILIGLVVKENLSTALIMVGIVFIIDFVASKKWVYFVIFFIGMIPLAYFAVTKVGYRNHRIVEWLNIETEGYQILQGLYAICSGGWFGKGLGNSVQKRGYIPEVHTDMIMTIIAEELGIIGVLILLLVYILLLYRIYKVIINAPDLFGSLLCTGIFVQLALQVLLNMAVVTNSIPSTGVVLPFVSNGGTALMILLAEMGVVLSVSNHIEYEE